MSSPVYSAILVFFTWNRFLSEVLPALSLSFILRVPGFTPRSKAMPRFVFSGVFIYLLLRILADILWRFFGGVRNSFASKPDRLLDMATGRGEDS